MKAACGAAFRHLLHSHGDLVLGSRLDLEGYLEDFILSLVEVFVHDPAISC